jgi:phosphoserine phosphatase
MEKARRISSQFDLSRYPEVYAYGDTSEDLEMLALAHR